MEEGLQRVAFQTRMGDDLVRMTSTLVETVSINYEDFNESFLTCGTCLCSYDGQEHTPKLLQCSHTVCLQCLTKIAAAAVPVTTLSSYSSTVSSAGVSLTGVGTPRESSTFRCPICRELIHVPRGGVSALPPSFLVNQLLDLMASQRREVIPKCSNHPTQELLFCETCDSVFCAVCVPSPHNGSVQNGDHTVIPFSIAIKRMSEILLYKANECLAKLNEATDSVSDEIRKLSLAAEGAEAVANKAFEEANLLLEKRRQTFLAKIKEVAGAKKEKLKEQLELIEKERAKVRQTCDGLEYQVEVRHITKRISELSTQLDSFLSLRHPRENAYLLCKTESDLMSLEGAVSTDIRTSTTFPPLCTLNIEPDPILAVGVEVELTLETRDYQNQERKTGGDPVRVGLTTPKKSALSPAIRVEDREDGTYVISFTPCEPGQHTVHVEIFGRGIGEDFQLTISRHNNPIKVLGRGELCQPVSGAKTELETFVLDTGNARVVVLDQGNATKRVLSNETLEGRSCTGIAYCVQSETLLIVNWRSKQVTRLSPKDGSIVSKFSHDSFSEPIGLAVDGKGNIYVADNGAHIVFIMDSTGQLKRQIERKFSLMGGIAVSGDGRSLVVADMSLYVFNLESTQENDSCTEIQVEGKGRFGGVCIDAEGLLIATRTEKGRSVVYVFKDGKLVSTIDSSTSKLKRPSDVLVMSKREIMVVDLGNDLLKQYRYK